MSDSLTVLAPAKLNLALAVGPLDASGYHPICSWMVTVGLYDELLVTKLEPDRLSRYAILWHEEARRRTDINWSIKKDLAVRAHLALEEHVGRRLPLQLKMEKRIPVGGGLGGGSSDAAAMLRAVNELFDLGCTTGELSAVAESLGSDVPYLVSGGSAIVEGRGEQVESHTDLPPLHAVLIMPDLECSTARVYALYDELSPRPLCSKTVRSLAGQGIGAVNESLFNDLAEPAMTAAPGLREIHQQVSAIADRTIHVSGSGSSLFALCDDAVHAEFLARAIEEQCSLAAVTVETVPGHVRASSTSS